MKKLFAILLILLGGCECKKKPEAMPQPIPQKVIVNHFINQFEDVDSIDMFLHFKDGSFINVRSPKVLPGDVDLEISSQGVIHVPKDIPHERICK